ncbi:MAG: lipid II flippase MurJ, partial [Verrucomicrobiota bacterium]
MISRIGLVSALTMASRILGLGRDILTSAVFGTSIWNSAFVTAFMIPNLFRRLLGEGALTAALMP